MQQKVDVMKDLWFFLVAELMLLGPTLLLCVVTGQIWPLFLMGICQIIGVLLGVIKFTRPTDAPECPAPSSAGSHVSPTLQMIDWKKAA